MPYFCRVKLFALLLPVYMLLLSVLPCCETGDCAVKQNQGVSISVTHTDHQGDTCTPFCACGCCSMQFSKAGYYIKLKSPWVSAVHYSTEMNLQLPDIYLPIWQPPQLS